MRATSCFLELQVHAHRLKSAPEEIACNHSTCCRLARSAARFRQLKGAPNSFGDDMFASEGKCAITRYCGIDRRIAVDASIYTIIFRDRDILPYFDRPKQGKGLASKPSCEPSIVIGALVSSARLAYRPPAGHIGAHVFEDHLCKREQ